MLVKKPIVYIKTLANWLQRAHDTDKTMTLPFIQPCFTIECIFWSLPNKENNGYYRGFKLSNYSPPWIYQIKNRQIILIAAETEIFYLLIHSECACVCLQLCPTRGQNVSIRWLLPRCRTTIDRAVLVSWSPDRDRYLEDIRKATHEGVILREEKKTCFLEITQTIVSTLQ